MDGETSDDIMSATYRALCTHGYADLTMQRIADETELSKAALHYHYETKEELLQSFLDHLIDDFESRLAREAGRRDTSGRATDDAGSSGTVDPDERLDAFVEAVFGPAEAGSDFGIALLEIKAQAPHSEAHRDRLHALDERMRETVASAVRDGIAAGRYDDCDPEDVARFTVTAINGAHVRGVVLDERPSEARRLLESYLDEVLDRGPDTEVPV